MNESATESISGNHWHRQPDVAGTFIFGLAVVAAPLEIWSVATIGGHGVTASHLVAIILSLLAVIRFRRLSLIGSLALYCVLAPLVWGIVVALLQSDDTASMLRTVKNAALFVLMVGAFTGATTVRLEWRTRRGMHIAGWGYTLVVVYSVYQFFARRMDWPLGFLRITNPSYLTDPYQPDLQVGATAAQQGWGEYFLRASATFAEPAHLGRYLSYGLAVGLALIIVGGRTTRWGVVASALAVVGLIVNQSLNGILAYVAVALVVGPALLRQMRVATLIRLAALTAFIGVPMAFIGGPMIYRNVVQRLMELSVLNSSGRFDSLPVVIATLKRLPWGAGLGNVAFGNEIHNGIMLFAIQFGLPGLIIPIAWATAIAGVMGILIMGVSDMTLTDRATLALSAGFLASQLAGWMSGGAMYHSFAWTMSGVAFGAIGRFVDSRVLASVQRPGARRPPTDPDRFAS